MLNTHYWFGLDVIFYAAEESGLHEYILIYENVAKSMHVSAYRTLPIFVEFRAKHLGKVDF